MFSCDHLNIQDPLPLHNQTSASDTLEDLGDYFDLTGLLCYDLPLENSDTHDTDNTM